jgi:cardiolipin synthase
MSIYVAIPVHRVTVRVDTDEARDWSVVHEGLMLAVTRRPGSLERLTDDTGLRKQVAVAAISRLMRHRLVEVVMADGVLTFQASVAGAELVNNGRDLPRFPRPVTRSYGLSVERYSGSCFRSREVSLVFLRDLERLRGEGHRVTVLKVVPGAKAVHHEVTLKALTEIVEAGGDRKMLRIKDGDMVSQDFRFMLVEVVDGAPRLPAVARQGLVEVVTAAANDGANDLTVEAVASPDPADEERSEFNPVVCDFDPADIVMGSDEQGKLLRRMMALADSRLVLLSTFLNVDKFLLLVPAFQAACEKNVQIDILWGSDSEHPETGKNAVNAAAIAKVVSEDPLMQGKVNMRMASTGSHAKIILADQSDGGWMAVVSSCNWLYSGFHSIEVSVVLRNAMAVADVITAVQKIVGRRTIADTLANELALTARDLRMNRVESSGAARVTLMVGKAHESLMLQASAKSTGTMLVSTHRVGGIVNPAVIKPASVAVSRGVEALVLWTQPNKPQMTKQRARAVQADAALEGVRMAAAKPAAHAKVLLWTPDDVAVTSHNWGSASSDQSFPFKEVGVHIQAPGLADILLARFREIYPNLFSEISGT